MSTPSTTASNAIRLNYDFSRTIPGKLKIGEVILGAVTVGCVGSAGEYLETAAIFFLLMATTFMMCTFCLLLSCVIRWRNSKDISETMFELIYHSIASIFIFSASIALSTGYRSHYHDGIYISASVIGTFTSILYFFSAICAYGKLVNVQSESGYYNSNSNREFSSTPKADEDNIRYI